VFLGFSARSSLKGVFWGFGGVSFLGLSAKRLVWGYFGPFSSQSQDPKVGHPKKTPLYIYIYTVGQKQGGQDSGILNGFCIEMGFFLHLFHLFHPFCIGFVCKMGVFLEGCPTGGLCP